MSFKALISSSGMRFRYKTRFFLKSRRSSSTESELVENGGLLNAEIRLDLIPRCNLCFLDLAGENVNYFIFGFSRGKNYFDFS